MFLPQREGSSTEVLPNINHCIPRQWNCTLGLPVLFFFPKSSFLDEVESSASNKKAPEINSSTHTVAEKSYEQYPYRGARLVRLFVVIDVCGLVGGYTVNITPED